MGFATLSVSLDASLSAGSANLTPLFKMGFGNATAGGAAGGGVGEPGGAGTDAGSSINSGAAVSTGSSAGVFGGAAAAAYAAAFASASMIASTTAALCARRTDSMLSNKQALNDPTDMSGTAKPSCSCEPRLLTASSIPSIMSSNDALAGR